MVRRSLPVIGLTGPMCAGKNRASDILKKRGFAVVDADIIAHQALDDRKNKILAAFSSFADKKKVQLCRGDGALDRRALGSLLFSEPVLLAQHETIIYPRINELLLQFINEHPLQVVVINAPLLHKSPVLEKCAFVIYIDAWPWLRFFRALKRDKMPFFQILNRFSAQKNLFAQYILKNVDIQRVPNRGSIRNLEKRLDTLLSHRGY